MPKVSLSDLASLANETSVIATINANNAAIEEGFNNTISRDGMSPNTFEADVDMNSHRIYNLPLTPLTNSDAATKAYVDTLAGVFDPDLSTDDAHITGDLTVDGLTTLNNLVLTGSITGYVKTSDIGVTVQPNDATLTSLAAYNTNGLLTQTAADTFTGRTITGTANEITATNGSGVSGNPTLSLPTSLTFTGKTVTGGTFSGPTITGGSITGMTDITVDDGGTGRSTATAYAVICGGTTNTGAHQSIASVGTSGQVLTSNGAGALPTFQTSSAAAGVVLLNSGSVSSAATLDIVLSSFTAYKTLSLRLDSFLPATDDVELWLRFSTNAGSSYATTNYSYALVGLNDAGSARNANGNGAAQILVAGAVTAGDCADNTASTGGIDGEISLFGRTSTSRWSRVSTRTVWYNGGEMTVQNGGGHIETAQDTDAIRLLFESGNIASGNWALYGYV